MTRSRITLIVCVPFVIAQFGCTTYFETPSSPTQTTPDNSVFTSQLARGGSASRAFTLANAGMIQMTLTSVVPPVVVGLGVGIPRDNGSGCQLTASVETAAGSSPQLVVNADAGTYCVKVYDVGLINDETMVSLTVK